MISRVFPYLFGSILLLTSCQCLTPPSNILVMLPFPFYSHTFTFIDVFKELTSRGHNLTIVTPYSFKSEHGEPIPNMNHIKIDTERISPLIDGFVVKLKESNQFTYLRTFWNTGVKIMDEILKEEPLVRLMNDVESKFDLVIAETQFLQEPFAAFAHKFSCPLINIYPIGTEGWVAYLTGNVLPVSFVPSYKSSQSNNMNFFQRLENTLIYLIEVVGSYIYYLPLQDEVMRKHFKIDDLPNLLDLLKNASLTLADFHFSVGYDRPFMSNIIQVGGMSIKTGKAPSQELKNLMDNCTEGFIYMSFGNHFDLSKLGEAKISSFMKGFGRLKQKVLLKWNMSIEIKDKPDNVITSNWFPQSSVLSHSNCKLFLTHGGVHSLTESIFYGVPIIGVPQFSDQEFNINYVVETGIGLRIGNDEINEEHIYSNIKKILETPKYKDKVMERSKIVLDRPHSPLESSVFWIEYVLRHKGAYHLQPSSLNLPFYQYYLLDIIAFVMLIIIYIIYLIRKLTAAIKNIFRSNDKIKTH